MNWEKIAPAFEADGALRDIYILETSLADWQAVLDGIRASQPAFKFEDAYSDGTFPVLAERLFAPDREVSPLLSLFIEGMQVNCHFFDADEIEFDLDPSEVTGQTGLDGLLAFMRLLSNATGKAAILTDENDRTNPIFRIVPGRDEPIIV